MAESENKVVTEEIGSVLRAAREAAGVSLDDVSALLKIRAVHLQALEEDDFDNLPGSVYAIGFIRTYANHLELNGAELIERYKIVTNPPHQDDAGYNPQTEVESISGALKIAIAVIGVFVFYILWLIAGGAGDDDTAKAPVAPVVAEKPATETKPAEKIATPIERPAAAAKQSAETAKTTNTRNDTQAVLPEADPVASQPAVEVQPIGTLSVAETAAPREAAAEVANAKIEIRAVRRTWMRIENGEGKVLFSSIIREGEGFTFGEDNAYTLATRDAGALEYRVNEQLVGSVGRRGQILTARKIERDAVLSLTRQ